LETPTEETVTLEELPEAKHRTHVGIATTVPEEPEMLKRFSNLRRLLRVTACRRWLPEESRQRHTLREPGTPSTEELDRSLMS